MIGRRAFGKAAAMAFGGLPPRRPDQHIPVGQPGMLPSPLTDIIRARQVIVGAAGGPQVLIGTAVNIPVTTQMPNTGAAASDISSISNLKNVVEMPTGLAGEVSPALMGPVQITYTDTNTADGLLILGGQRGANAAFPAMFQLHVSMSTGAVHPAGLISGSYTSLAGTVKLFPRLVQVPNTGPSNTDVVLGLYNPTKGAVVLDQASGVLIPAPQAFGDLGSTGLAGDAGSASWEYGIDGYVILSVHKSFTALGAQTTATFANALVGNAVPPNTRLTGGVPVSLVGAAPVAGTRLTITNPGGAVNLVNLPAGASAVGCDVRIPLT